MNLVFQILPCGTSGYLQVFLGITVHEKGDGVPFCLLYLVIIVIGITLRKVSPTAGYLSIPSPPEEDSEQWSRAR